MLQLQCEPSDRYVVNERSLGGDSIFVGPRYFDVNLSFQKTISLKSEAGRTSVQSLSGPNMTFVLNLWNAFNHSQYQNYSGVMTSTFFGRPNRANNPRSLEVGLRFTFWVYDEAL